MSNIYIGHHINKDKGFAPKLKSLTKISSLIRTNPFLQINVASKFGVMTKDIDYELFKPIRSIVHASYNAYPFVTPENGKRTIAQSIEAKKIGAEGIVIHLSSSKNLFCEAQTRSLRNVCEKSEVKVLLENHSGKAGINSYETPAKLNKLVSYLIEKKVPNWGLCIDTAHLFVTLNRAGEPILDDAKSMKTWLDTLTNESKNAICAFHFNGCHNPIKDKHAIPCLGSCEGKDLIWDKYKKATLSETADALMDSAWKPIFEFCANRDIPLVYEHKFGTDKEVIEWYKLVGVFVEKLGV